MWNSDNRIQRRLPAEADLSFKKAFELAQAMESADRNTQDLKPLDSQQQCMRYTSKAAVGSATDLGAGTGQETKPPGKGPYCRVCRSITQEAKSVPAGQ